VTADTLHKLNELVKAEEVQKKFPKLPKPDHITVSEYTDSIGDDAYEIVIVYADKVPDKALDFDKLSPMVKWIRNLVFQYGEADRWPYFRFFHKSDLKSVQY